MKRNSFSGLLRFIQRKRHAHGFGLHSPFAFHLVTRVIYDKSPFNAFFDIDQFLTQNELDPNTVSPAGQTVFRLINYFRSTRVLEINSGNGAFTPFLLAPDSNIRCTCIESDSGNVASARTLLADYGDRIRFSGTEALSAPHQYDVICLHLCNNGCDIALDNLIAASHEDTFLFIDNIRNRPAKQIWANIVKDGRVWISFDMDHAGIAFLKPSYSKTNYLI